MVAFRGAFGVLVLAAGFFAVMLPGDSDMLLTLETASSERSFPSLMPRIVVRQS